MADSIFAGLERINNADLDKLTALIKKILDDLEKAKKGQEDADKKKKEKEDADRKAKEEEEKKKKENDKKKSDTGGDAGKEKSEDDEEFLKRMVSALETAKKRGLLK